MCCAILRLCDKGKKKSSVWNDDEFTEAVMLGKDTDSDSEDEAAIHAADVIVPPPPVAWGSGSRCGKARNAPDERHRVFYACLLYDDFWGDSPVYNKPYLKRFCKLPFGLFDDIVHKVSIHDPHFEQKKDAAGKWGLTPLQKISLSVRQLTSGVCSGEHPSPSSMERFS